MKSPLSNKNVKMIECRLRAVFHSWSPGWAVFWRHGAEGSPRAAPPDNTPAVGVKRAAAAVLAGLITQAFLTSLSHSPGALVIQGRHHCPGAEHIKVSPSTVRTSRWRRLLSHSNALTDSWWGSHESLTLVLSGTLFHFAYSDSWSTSDVIVCPPHTLSLYMILAIAGFVSLQLHQMSDFVLRKVTWQAFDLN